MLDYVFGKLIEDQFHPDLDEHTLLPPPIPVKAEEIEESEEELSESGEEEDENEGTLSVINEEESAESVLSHKKIAMKGELLKILRKIQTGSLFLHRDTDGIARVGSGQIRHILKEIENAEDEDQLKEVEEEFPEEESEEDREKRVELMRQWQEVVENLRRHLEKNGKNILLETE